MAGPDEIISQVKYLSVLFHRANGAEVTSPGQRPGYLFPSIVRPEGAEEFHLTRSVPQETLIKIDLVPFQE